MATEKTLKTRIVQKIDTLANWESSSLPLKKGEIAFATATVNNKNVILAKIGDGENTWKNTDYNFYANAADVGDWGKIDDIEYENSAINFYTTEIKYDSTNKVDKATKVLVDSVTISDISEIKNYLVQAGEGLTGGGKISTNPTIAHAVPTDYKSTITGGSEETDTFVTGVVRDKFGHITDVTTGKVTVPELPEISITATDDDVVILTASAEDHVITVDAKHKSDYRNADESKGPIADVTVTANTTADEAKTIKVPSLTADKYGHVKVLGEQTLSINIPKIPTIPDIVVTEENYAIQPLAKDTEGNITGGDTEIRITKDIRVEGDKEGDSTTPNKHKIIEEKVVVPTKQYVQHLIDSVKVNIVDKDKEDDADKGLYWAVTDLTEGTDVGEHKIIPTYTQLVSREYVDRRVNGAVNYLGTVCSEEEVQFYAGLLDETDEFRVASKGDFMRVADTFIVHNLIVDPQHDLDGKGSGVYESYELHPSDMIIYEGARGPDGIKAWAVIHGEIDSNDWVANSASAAGYVAAGSGHANQVWKTNASGAPAWRDDEDTQYDLTVDNTSIENGVHINLENKDDASDKDTITIEGNGDTTVSLTGKVITITGTDRSVTEEQYHYTPTTKTESAITATAENSSEYLEWDSSQVITGITLQRDGKGHVTGISAVSEKMPVNPNTDTNTDTTYTISAAEDTTNNAAIVNLVGGGDGVGSGVTDSIKIKGGNNITISVDQSNPEVITITGEDGNITSKTTVGATTSKTYKEDGVTETTVESEIKNKTYSAKLSHIEGTTENASTTFKANTGLKLTSTTGDNGSITFDFDDDIEFIFDCGNSSAR